MKDDLYLNRDDITKCVILTDVRMTRRKIYYFYLIKTIPAFKSSEGLKKVNM